MLGPLARFVDPSDQALGSVLTGRLKPRMLGRGQLNGTATFKIFYGSRPGRTFRPGRSSTPYRSTGAYNADKTIEAELGINLFERLKRGVRLSVAGKAFLEETRRILGGVETAIERTKLVAEGKVGQLRIGFVDTVMLGGEAPVILNEFRRRFPDVRLLLQVETSVNCGTLLRDKEINVGIVHWPPQNLAELRSSRIGKERLLLAVPKPHSFGHRRKLSLRDLDNVPFVWLSRNVSPMYCDRVFHACHRAGLVPRIVQEANSIPTMLGLVAAGMGVSFVHESAEHWKPDNVVLVKVSDFQLTVNVYVIWRADDWNPSLPLLLKIASAPVA